MTTKRIDMSTPTPSVHPTIVVGFVIGLWKFLASYVQSIEGIGAVGAVFEEVFFCFGLFLSAFVLVEAITVTGYAGCLDGKDEIIIVLAVEERHESLIALEGLVDEQVFLIVAHRIAEIDVIDFPTAFFEFVDDDPAEVLGVDGIVGTEGSGVVVENDALALVVGVV